MSRNLLDKYIPLVHFLGDVLGKNFEIILHDIGNEKNSIIAIEHGFLSGRKKGDPMTDLAINIVKSKEHQNKDYITNYEGKTVSGKSFVSSTYFIKKSNSLIGMICINHDVSDIMGIDLHLKNIMDTFSVLPESRTKKYKETLDGSINDMSSLIISQTIRDTGINATRMTVQEKKEFIATLDKKGVFDTKGSVDKVATNLTISKSSVYRYLSEIRDSNKNGASF